MELPTREVRWFLPGECPAAIREWFAAGPLLGDLERRTDHYFILAGRADLGVKLRGGSVLDLKVRTGGPDDVIFVDGVAGRAEDWSKWSFPLSTNPSPMGSGWVAVEKSRRSRLYEVTAGGKARAVPGAGEVTDGCAAELVELEVGRLRAWGFGFEAFATLLPRRAVLEAAVVAFAGDTPLAEVGFDIADSCGYPAWLSAWPGPQ